MCGRFSSADNKGKIILAKQNPYYYEYIPTEPELLST
jgi:hypothetical protein